MTDADIIYRWLTQAEIDAMLEEARLGGFASGHASAIAWAVSELRVQCTCDKPGCSACLVARYLARGGPS